ncbi:hypothetical protein ACQKMI_10775 [Lysinibacillus sp. NPDC097214]
MGMSSRKVEVRVSPEMKKQLEKEIPKLISEEALRKLAKIIFENY